MSRKNEPDSLDFERIFQSNTFSYVKFTPPPVELGLNLEDLAKLKKTEALKRFKALKTVFRNTAKCKGIILLIDFPGFADKKKQSIILPFKKLAELKEQWKKLKKDKPLPLSRVAVCQYELDEADEVRCTQIFGAAAAEKVQAELTELLGLFKLKVALALDLQPDGDEDEAEVAKTEADSPAAKTPTNPREALLAAKTSLQDLGKLKELGQIEKQYQTILKELKAWYMAHQQKARPKDELELVKKMKEGLPKVLEKARLNVFESYLDKVEKQPELLAQYRPQFDELIAKFKAAASV